MNPKQRLIAAIRGQQVDRLPAMTYNFYPYTDQWRRQHDGTYLGPAAYQPMMDAVWRTHTGMLVKVSARCAGDRQERTWSEQLKEGTSSVRITYLETPKGRLHARLIKPAGQPGYHVKKLIAREGDLEKYLSLPNEPSTVDLASAKAVYEELGDRGLAYLH